MSGSPLRWLPVAEAAAVPLDDMIEFQHGGKRYLICHTHSGFYATDGLCTHEAVRLVDGLILDDVIECPRHQGRFDIPSGEALSAPACDALRTYPVRIVDGRIQLGLTDDADPS